MEHEIQTQAEWLLDAIATATQDRRFLCDDPQCDAVACEAIISNARKAMEDLLKCRTEAAEAEAAQMRDALIKSHALLERADRALEQASARADEAEAEVERLLDELGNAVDGHWDAEPSWYADKVLAASPYTG